MISLTGGFNQAYASGAPKIQKLKYAVDTMAFSDAVTATATAQHFNEPLADSLTLSDAASAELAAA